MCRSIEARCITFTTYVLCDLSLPPDLSVQCLLTFKIQPLSLFGVQHHLVVPPVGQRWLAAKSPVSSPMGTHHDDLCQLVRLEIYWAQAFPQRHNLVSFLKFALSSTGFLRNALAVSKKLVKLRRFCCGQEKPQGDLISSTTCRLRKVDRPVFQSRISFMSDRPSKIVQLAARWVSVADSVKPLPNSVCLRRVL